MQTPRLIRSFVRREGRITSGQKQALALHGSVYGLSTEQGLASFSDVFHNAHPVVLEIGFGMGQSLLTLAQENPACNFVGIEVHRPGVGKLLAEAYAQQVTNLKVYQEDAVEVLKKVIPDASLYKVLIYFPDPWHKKRHNKRRLIQPDFVALLQQKLAPEGCVYLATDWEDYAHHMLATFNAAPGFVNQSDSTTYIPRPTWRPVTKFELRGQKLGHGVWDLCFKKAQK